MSGITSALISTANLGEWNYYVMSDLTPIWRSMNGLAAWFNGQGALLQGGAWLGALIALSMAIYSTAVGKKSVSTGVIGTWFLFMCSIGMTGTANVINIYSGTVTTVANVPALALVPASIFSSAAYKVFTSMEAAFATTSGGYMSVSENGFVGPLDLLLTLRSDKFPAAHPALQRTLVQVVFDCGVDSTSSAALSVTMKDTLDVLSWLKAYGRQSGITNVYTESDASGNGTIYSCADALNYLDNQFNTLASGSSGMIAFINANTKKVNPGTINGRWGSSAISDSFDTLLGGISAVTQNSIQFTKNALVSSTVAGTIDCLGNSGMMTSPDTCATSSLVLNDGKERWKTNAVMNGSGFIKVMFTSMGFLQILFFSLFPFIALYGLIVINKTVQVFGGYVLFGIWSQSWLLVVAPIQSYIQNSVIFELTRAVGSTGGMTMANQAAIYTILSDKLAVASDMMANSQMLSLALLSGSIYALSGLVGKSSGSQQMDSSLIQRKIGDGSALTSGGTVMSMNTMANRDGTSTVVGTRTGASNLALGSSSVITSSAGSTSGTDHSISKEQSKVQDRMKQELAKWGYSKEESASISNSIGNTLSYQGSINSSMGSGFIKALRNNASKSGTPFTSKQEAMATKMFQSAQSTAVNKLVSSDKGFWSKLNSDNKEERASAYEKVVDVSMDLLDAVGTGASVASIGMTGGVSTPLAAGSIAAIRAGKEPAKKALKEKIRDNMKAEAKDAGQAALGNSARGTLRNLTSGFGEAIAGGVGAVATAAHNELSKKENGVSAKRGLGRDSTDSASISAALRETVGDSYRYGYSESAGQSYVQTAAVNMDMAGLVKSVAKGYGDQSGSDMRAALAFNKSVLLTNGSYSPEAIKSAEMKTKDFMSGYDITSNTNGVSSEDIRTGVGNALFQQFLTNTVKTSFNSPNPHAAGSDVLQATPHLKTPDLNAAPQARQEKGKSGGSGKPAPEKKPFLVDVRNGEVPDVPNDQTIVQKVDGAIDKVKGFFTGSKPAENEALSVATESPTVNPNKSVGPMKKSGSGSAPVAGASTGGAAGNTVARPEAMLDAADPANNTFDQQPVTAFKNLPQLVNQTSGDRERIVASGAKNAKGLIDDASKRQEGELGNSANPNAVLANWNVAGKYGDAAAAQQELVQDATIAAAVGGMGAAAIGSAAEILGGGFGQGGGTKPPTTTGGGNAGGRASTAGSPAPGSGTTGTPASGGNGSPTSGAPGRTREPVNPRTVGNRTPRFGRR